MNGDSFLGTPSRSTYGTFCPLGLWLLTEEGLSQRKGTRSVIRKLRCTAVPTTHYPDTLQTPFFKVFSESSCFCAFKHQGLFGHPKPFLSGRVSPACPNHDTDVPEDCGQRCRTPDSHAAQSRQDTSLQQTGKHNGVCSILSSCLAPAAGVRENTALPPRSHPCSQNVLFLPGKSFLGQIAQSFTYLRSWGTLFL